MDKTEVLAARTLKILAPPPKLTVSEWADQNRVLSKEASAEAGRWRTSRAPYQKEMMDAVNDPAVETVVLMTSSQIGKALDVNTPIPTPAGWKVMRDIVVGDQVFDENGEICNVIYATSEQHNRECFEVTFSDNSKIVADADHQWFIQSNTALMPGNSWHGKGKREGTLTTKEIHETFKHNTKGRKSNRYAIPVAGALSLPEIELPIKPYTLGVWLGDGNSHSAQVTLGRKDLEIANYIESDGYKVVVRQTEKRNKNVMNLQIDPKVRYKNNACIRGHNLKTVGKTKNGGCAECNRQHALSHLHADPGYCDPIINRYVTFHSVLESSSLLKSKHIPKAYLRASYNQRLELLRGIMDSDGYIDKNGRCEIAMKSQSLINDISELLLTLSIKHTIIPKDVKCCNSTNGTSYIAWRISFLVYDKVPIFKLQRKRKMQKSETGCRTTETHRRRVVNVEKTNSRPVKCISVDSSNNLYLAGKNMIPTHNTEIENNLVGYYINYDPAPMLFIMPTKELAESYSKDRLAPMVRDTPVLKNRVREVKTRDSDNTILHKKFSGGHISMIGANAPASLSSRPIRIVLADEVDRFPHSAGVEGDPLSLADKRTKTFWNRKKIYVSTPTIKDESRIEAEYLDGTMEQWHLPCPGCGKLQPLTWAQIKFEDVTHECIKCKERYGEFEWKNQEGKWVARNENPKKRSFHVNALSSPWERWADIIADFRRAKTQGPEVLKVWVNTSLGETWEDQSPQTTEDELMKRRERYQAELPDGVLVLTAGVDVQDDRLEAEVVGWGEGKKSWGIEYRVFYGDPGQVAVWDQLDEFLSREWSFVNGERLNLSCACVDSGGHYTTEVYRFTKKREHRRIFPIKGEGGTGKPLVGKARRSNRENVALFPVGADTGKELVMTRLKVEYEGQPGYCSWPVEQEKGYDEMYFQGLCSERRVIKYDKGRPKVQWVRKGNVYNEPLDVRNYATAALEILNPNLEKMAEEGKTGSIFIQHLHNKRSTTRKKVISKGVTV